ncbi:MAG: hypothetical protein KC415_14720, partial [Anaerolineales bacterium]|nr:hypothetical protein [Anaerolineales bacterium]
MPQQNVGTGANPRNVYIYRTLGLEHDPFAYATAELELQINSDDPPFLTYFVDLPAAKGQGSLLENLQQSGHAVVYGDIGSGKTTLRYALEAQCRGLAQQVLIVSQELGKGEPGTAVIAPTLQTFTQALATDLFVQTIERFDTLPSVPDAKLTTALSHYWHQHIPNFHRSLRRHLRQGQSPDVPTGISPWWRTWKRVVVRYTPLTKARKQFLQQVLDVGEREKREVVEETAVLQQGIILAQQLGFQQLYYLLDAADTPQFDINSLLTHLHQISKLLPEFPTQIPISLKLFLPKRIKSKSQHFFSQPDNTLISPSFSALIKWNYSLLHALIENRFRSAGSWIRGIEVLTSQESPVDLESELIQSAQQSPRRLIQILSSLINIHVNRTPIEPTITNSDLQQTLQNWSDNTP